MNTEAPARLLFVGNFFASDRGSSQYCTALADRLAERGHRVLRTSLRRARLLRLLDMGAAVYRHRQDYDVMIVDVFSGPAFLWAELAVSMSTRFGKPTVLALRGGGLPAWAMGHAARVARLLRKATAVTTPSRYLHEAMVGFRGDRLLLPNAIEVAAYRWRRRMAPTPSLVWLRAFHRIYNPLLAVETFSRVKDRIPAARMVMIGPDKGDGTRRKVIERVRELGLAMHLTVLDGVGKADVPRCLEQGDIFLNSADIDNTPVSVLEALASGLCVVSTDVGGIPYLLDHGNDSLLVPPAQPEAMADAVLRVIRDPELAARLSRNARIKAESFDWSVVLPQWEALLALTVRSPDEMR